MYYDQRIEKGKNKMSTINIIRNKLLSRIFAVIDRKTPYVDTMKFAAWKMLTTLKDYTIFNHRIRDCEALLCVVFYLYKSPWRYFKPESQITVTILLPSPIILALWIAAQTLAPEVIPPKIPSSVASFLEVS